MVLFLQLPLSSCVVTKSLLQVTLGVTLTEIYHINVPANCTDNLQTLAQSFSLFNVKG